MLFRSDIARVEAIELLLEQLETRAEGVAVDVRPATGSLPAALVRLADHESIGTVAVPGPAQGRWLGRLPIVP